MNTNLAVAYTEYQLLQIESLVSHYQLKNVVLVLHNKNNRIQDWLIDRSLFVNVVSLPLKERGRRYKLSKEYVREYCSVVSGVLKNQKINLLIGAQDENTIFAIIKHYANPQYYWNIEDGNANYLRENFQYRLEIFMKKLLFTLYGYGRLDIRYGHGLVKSDKAFRLYPKLSVTGGNCIFLGDLLAEYLKKKVEQIRTKVDWIAQYTQFDKLVVSDVSCMHLIVKTQTENELYKFHPENKVNIEGVVYIKEHIPIEFLPWLLPNIKTIRYQIYSSSILSMLVLHSGLRIQLDYLPPNNAYTFYTNNIIKEFKNRIEVLQC